LSQAEKVPPVFRYDGLGLEMVHRLFSRSADNHRLNAEDSPLRPSPLPIDTPNPGSGPGIGNDLRPSRQT